MDYSLLVPASPNNGPLLNNLIESYYKYKNSFTNNLIIFGDSHRTSCYQSKMIKMYEILKNLKTEFIIVIDAFDLIFNKELDESLFKEFEKNTNLKFIFGSELNCFPYPEYSKLFEDNAKDTKLKYLNGGVIIAKRLAYIEMLEEFLNPNKYNQYEWINKSDQAPYTLLYKNSIENKDNSVIIDTNCKFSIQMFLMEKDKDYKLDENNQLTYLESQNIPYFVHFNGDSKNQMEYFNIKYGE